MVNVALNSIINEYLMSTKTQLHVSICTCIPVFNEYLMSTKTHNYLHVHVFQCLMNI